MTTIIRINAPIGEDIGELSAKWLQSQFPTDNSPIECRLHSPGGSVLEAFAMIDELKAYRGKKTAVVSAMAFSAASLLLSAFDEVEITPNGYVMIHQPHFEDDGPTRSERSFLGSLGGRMVGIYCEQTGKSADIIHRMMSEERYFDAEAAIDFGLADRVRTGLTTAVARVPQRVVAMAKAKETTTATQRWRAAVAEASKTMPRAKAMVYVDKTEPGLRRRMIEEANQ
ncbi:Clp protease ClpP [Rhodopirellula europaea]|uniref:Clp protease ClpP n=1 Tax=Rhodopirellula europaea TaxID=1263866 RepID=UPI003D2CDB8A|tara:strand:+ start:11395 stop:12075 length:681 start_codon:yes stop_codon:yes gene_type:complete